jgi:hypothetical protein
MPSGPDLHYTNVHRFNTSPVCQRTAEHDAADRKDRAYSVITGEMLLRDLTAGAASREGRPS